MEVQLICTECGDKVERVNVDGACILCVENWVEDARDANEEYVLAVQDGPSNTAFAGGEW